MNTTEKPRKLGPLASIGGVLAVLCLKFKVAIFGLLKALPFILKGSMTLLVSLGIYWAIFGWRYAVTLVGLIFVHEMGHYIWMKAYGLNPKAPVFVPFMGAYTAMSNMPPDPVTHAWVAYAGPLVGGLGAAVLWWLGFQSGNFYLVAAANTGFLLNLLQLVPVRPFDGGFITACISKWLSIPGIIALAVIAMSFHSFLLGIIGLVGFVVMFKQWNKPQTPVSWMQRGIVTIAYFGLAGLLAFLYWISQLQLHSSMGHGM